MSWMACPLLELGVEGKEDSMTAVGNFDLKFEWVFRSSSLRAGYYGALDL